MRVAVSSHHPVIAIVDDDRSVCSGVQRLLRSAGLDATAFTSGLEFLASLQTRVPDCVVLDLSMPIIDGLGVQAQLAGARMALPIIFISATEPGEQCRQALAAGAFAFLQKPFEDQVLLDTIDAALREAPGRPASH